MKKTMLILTAAVLVLILVTGGLIWYLISAISKAGAPADARSVEDYLAGQWPGYRLEEWDPDTGDLRLSRSLNNTYEQLEKYGAQAEMNDLVLGHLDTIEVIAAGLNRNCGVRPERITVVGLSSDGQTAYTVCSDGTITTCWEGGPDAPSQ